MPIVSYVPRQVIESEHDTVTKLMEKCKSCDLLKDLKPKLVAAMSISDYNNEKNGLPAMIAIAQYPSKGITAIYEPEWLAKNQMAVIYYFVRDNLESIEEIVVFSKRAYNAIKSYNFATVNVQLCT